MGEPIMVGALGSHLLERIAAASLQGHHIVIVDVRPKLPEPMEALLADAAVFSDATRFVAEYGGTTNAPDPHWKHSYPPPRRRKGRK